MCGRYALFSEPAELQAHFQLDTLPVGLRPHYNIPPGQDAPVIRAVAELGRHLDTLHWGLVPFWAKEKKIGNRMINARAESVAQKPAFRAAFRRRRCLVPANGFYEWHREAEGKQPYWIGFEDRRPLAFAGLWEHWEEPDGGNVLESFTIITAPADRNVAPLHERMPVLIPPEHYDLWLDPRRGDDRALRELLRPPEDSGLRPHPVSREVNSPLKDNPQLIEPVS